MIYWEDLQPGRQFSAGPVTVSEAEIIAFARQFDPQYYHTDPEAARQSIFGTLVASGWHSCSIAMRLLCEALLNHASSLGSPGVDELRWHLPVKPGDRLRFTLTIEESRASKSQPDRGIVRQRMELHNQDDRLVLSMIGIGLYGRRAHQG